MAGIEWPWETARARRAELACLRAEVARRKQFAADLSIVAPHLFDVLSATQEVLTVGVFYLGGYRERKTDWDYDQVHRLALIARTHDDDMAALELLREGGLR